MDPETRWYGCQICSCLTADFEEHNKRLHDDENEQEQEEEENMVCVRLELPDDFNLMSDFPYNTALATVLIYWAEECHSHVPHREGQEVLIICGDRELTTEEFDVTLEELGVPRGEEVVLEYNLVEETEQLTKEDQHIRACEARLIDHQDASNQPSFQDMVNQVNEDRPRASNPMVEEIIIALQRPDSPFHHSAFPHNVNSNQYIVILQYSKAHMPLAYHHCLSFKPACTQYVTKDLFVIAQNLANMVHMVDNRSSSLHKLNTVLLKSSGLSNAGLDATQRSGHSQTAASFRAIKRKLACLADGVIKKVSKFKLPLIMFDNMDMTLR